MAPDFFFFFFFGGGVFAKDSLIKNIFEKEKKKFDSRTRFFGKVVPYWVYFGQGEDFMLTMKLSEKVQ